MSATPRRGTGAFPQTPATNARRQAPATPNSPPTTSNAPARDPLPMAPQNTDLPPSASEPLIPTTILDAPTQRFYALAIYVCLLAWKLYDWVQIVEDGGQSGLLFLKWAVIDLIFLYALPEFRIPWLELSQFTVLWIFFAHAVLDFGLMFNIGLPFSSVLLGFLRVFYDREIAITEQYVKASSILHNSSLIMGRQIINILPEGNAVLNPGGDAFCLGGDNNVIYLPIHFNATVPIEVELIRTDLNTNEEEVLKLSKSQIREIDKTTKRQSSEPELIVMFDYPVKKPGVYRLGQVLDEYKLQVQRRTPSTYVVPCPKARITSSPSSERCLGDLSDLSLEVEGTPPLKIVYSRTINGKDHSFHFQSLQPEGFSSPLLGSLRTSAMILPDNEDVSWARAQPVTVSLNESMHVGGDWQYTVDEVHDAFGNFMMYPSQADDPELKPKPKHLVRDFMVKERPVITLKGCDLRNPLKVAKGKATKLPVNFDISGQRKDTAHELTWLFSPIRSLTKSGDHGDAATTGAYKAKNVNDRPSVSAPGLYTLKSVSSGACEGEVQEPASCLLLNPLEPSLVLRSQNIADTCKTKTIGLKVDLDFVGTPPFTVNYEMSGNGASDRKTFTVNSMRHQLDLIPFTAGDWKYTFKSIGDAVYPAQPLSGPDMTLETTVKPQAMALITSRTDRISACLEEEVEVDVRLMGEAPFTLEWELVHDGRRTQHKVENIQENGYKIKTKALGQGGEYTIAIVAITDKPGCRTFMEQEIKISVRRQRPRAAFGHIDGKLRTMTVENALVKLPLRLTGEGPWTVSYQNVDDGPTPEVKRRVLKSGNDFLDVKTRGTFEIVDVSDNQCHGTVDPKLSRFEIGWFPRPELSLIQTDSILRKGSQFVKRAVCEGDIDGFEIGLKGSAPYHVEYEVKLKPETGGSGAINRKEFDAALSKASIQMDTSRAGTYSYHFTSLADNLYNDGKKFNEVVLEQLVNAKPSAAFVKTGQTFKMCMSEQDNEDRIPIKLKGVAPFSLEIEIKHQSGAFPETLQIPSIESNSYDLLIPRRNLRLGNQQIRIRKVTDSRGCQQNIDLSGPSVSVQLYDAPAIYPLETRNDYCVGERIAYTLSGTPPFEVWYTFDGSERKAKSTSTTFRRIAEYPGEFAITTISDKASECRAAVNLTKTIHPMPSVKISKGKQVQVDIHEGGEVEIVFDFTGTPPFEWTYTRSTNAKRGQRSIVLETRHDISYEHSKIVQASQEGTYEVVAIKDAHCSFSTQQMEGKDGGQKMLQY